MGDENEAEWLTVHRQNDIEDDVLTDLVADAYLGICHGDLAPLKEILMSPYPLHSDIRELLVDLLTPENWYGGSLQIVTKGRQNETVIKRNQKENEELEIIQFIETSGALVPSCYNSAIKAAMTKFKISRGKATAIWSTHLNGLKETGIIDRVRKISIAKSR